MTALTLQLRNHALLRLVTGAAARQQTPRQVLLVVALEDILVLEEAEDGHHLLQARIDLHVARHALQTPAEHVVDEEREVLGRARVPVQEGLEGLLESQLEVLALFEGFLDELVVLLLEGEDPLDVGDRVLDLLRIIQDVAARFADAINHDLLHLFERRWRAAEEPVHALEVLNLVVQKHPGATRVLHVDQRLAMGQDPLLIAQALDLLHRRLMKVVLDPCLLLLDPMLGLPQVVRACILGDVLNRLILVELPRVIQELVLKALSVDASALHPKFH
mmetsp:Transcript_92680/g.299819  ORF Transcript_92680/g.299819 Transcript_92680/m.299819 type:complete len:276 (-) Transcript_92680:625-1452(-)